MTIPEFIARWADILIDDDIEWMSDRARCGDSLKEALMKACDPRLEAFCIQVCPVEWEAYCAIERDARAAYGAIAPWQAGWEEYEAIERTARETLVSAIIAASEVEP